jgi:tryptophan-rich sensory protein
MKLALWLIISFLPGLFGRVFKPGAWYETLPKAPWTPPNIAFPIVWSTLYACMGVAAWLVFKDGFAQKRGALTLFIAQLILNALWSWLFFGRHWVGGALIELAVLTVLVFATLIEFRGHTTFSALLMTPYFLWLLVALSLNGYIWWQIHSRPI